MEFETRSARLTATSETLHCNLSRGDRSVTHLVRIKLLKKIYSDIRVTANWISAQSLLTFVPTGLASAPSASAWTETKSVTPASTSTQNFMSVTIERATGTTPTATPVDIETKVEANPPWQPQVNWYTVDTVGFAVNAMP